MSINLQIFYHCLSLKKEMIICFYMLCNSVSFEQIIYSFFTLRGHDSCSFAEIMNINRVNILFAVIAVTSQLIHNERNIYVQIMCFSWHKISRKRSMYQLEDSTQQSTRIWNRDFPYIYKTVCQCYMLQITLAITEMNILTMCIYHPGPDNTPKCIGT